MPTNPHDFSWFAAEVFPVEDHVKVVLLQCVVLRQASSSPRMSLTRVVVSAGSPAFASDSASLSSGSSNSVPPGGTRVDVSTIVGSAYQQKLMQFFEQATLPNSPFASWPSCSLSSLPSSALYLCSFVRLRNITIISSSSPFCSRYHETRSFPPVLSSPCRLPHGSQPSRNDFR